MEERPRNKSEDDQEDYSSEKIDYKKSQEHSEFTRNNVEDDRTDQSEKENLTAGFKNIFDRILPSDEREVTKTESLGADELEQAEIRIDHQEEDSIDAEEAYFDKRHELKDLDDDYKIGEDDEEEEAPIVGEPTSISSILAGMANTLPLDPDDLEYYEENYFPDEERESAENTKHVSTYRQSIQMGFIVGILFIIFGVLFMIIS